MMPRAHQHAGRREWPSVQAALAPRPGSRQALESAALQLVVAAAPTSSLALKLERNVESARAVLVRAWTAPLPALLARREVCLAQEPSAQQWPTWTLLIGAAQQPVSPRQREQSAPAQRVRPLQQTTNMPAQARRALLTPASLASPRLVWPVWALMLASRSAIAPRR
jgi:hypothetical protein